MVSTIEVFHEAVLGQESPSALEPSIHPDGPAVFEEEEKQAFAWPPAPQFAPPPQVIVLPHPSGTVPRPACRPPCAPSR
jgi:hypothetical protein